MKNCIYCKQKGARKYIGWAWAHQRCIDALRAALAQKERKVTPAEAAELRAHIREALEPLRARIRSALYEN